jgi:hypothetical protein
MPQKGKGIALLLGPPEGEGEEGMMGPSTEGLAVALKDLFESAKADDWEGAALAFADALKLADEED